MANIIKSLETDKTKNGGALIINILAEVNALDQISEKHRPIKIVLKSINRIINLLIVFKNLEAKFYNDSVNFFPK